MPRYPVTIDGQTIEVEADSPEGAARRAFAQMRVAETKAPAAPSPAAPPMRDLTGARREMTPATGLRYDPTGAGEVAAMREGQAPGTAFALRTLPGMAGGAVGGTPGASVGYGVGEYAAQKLEQATGARKDVDPLGVGIAAAVPPVVAGAGRVVRGLGRTITRVLPSRFRAAHETALGAADDLSQSLRPEADPGAMFRAARAAGAESVPATKTLAMLDDMNRSIPATPASPGLKVVREHMDNITAAVKDGSMSLESLMALRRDLGASLGRAKEMRGLYKGLIGDLETAAKAGGPGATLAKDALVAFKRDLGASKLDELVTASTGSRAIAGADTPVLNMPKFARSFAKDAKEYTDLLGPEGVQAVGAFIQRFKSLPPEVAWNGWNLMLTGLFGGAGFVGGGPLPAIGAALGQELARNAVAVGKNPEALNRYMTTLVQAARAAAVTQPEAPAE